MTPRVPPLLMPAQLSSAAMTRQCARPSCDRQAVATLSYQYSASVVWLEPLAPEPHPMTHDLCELHAESQSVPMGWELRDERVPRLPVAVAAEIG